MTTSKLIVFVLVVKFAMSDEYLNETAAKCHNSSKFFTCAKYRLLKYLDNYHVNEYRIIDGDSELRLINISNPDKRALFNESRQFADDSELAKLLKFFQRQTENFLNNQGLSFALPEGARVFFGDEDDSVGGDRESSTTRSLKSRQKKKKQLIIPLLILFKLFKIKVLVTLALMSIFFIKKTILIAALILPSVVLSIKNHCKQQQYHVVPYHVDDGHYHHDHDHEPSSTGFGFSGYGSGKQDWERAKNKRLSYGYTP